MANFGEIIRRVEVSEIIDLRTEEFSLTRKSNNENGFDPGLIKRPVVVLAEAIVDTSESMKHFTDSEGKSCDGQATIISCYNKMLSDMKTRDNRKVQVVFSARGFDGMLQEHAFPQHCAPLTTSRYKPAGGTPLLDTLGDSFTALGLLEEKFRNGNIQCRKAFMILSDGEEQSSSRYNLEQVRSLIDKVYQDDRNFIVGIGLGSEGCQQLKKIGIKWVCDATGKIPLDTIFREFTTMTTQGIGKSKLLDKLV